MGDRAHPIEVLLSGQVGADLPLGDQEDLLLALHGPFQRPDGDLPLHVEGQGHMGKNRQAPESQHG